MSRVNQSAFEKTGIHYSSIQTEAIKQAVLCKMLIITGGPGTGKITTLLGIISTFQALNQNVLLASPTGRTAKRMSETCGMEAKTIHRLLNFKPPNGFEYNDTNPLTGDVVILNECSMIDIVLMNNLLKAVPDSMKVIFIGDIDQLLSVGPGKVLADLISSTAIKTIRLNSVFRQASGSDIIRNAHRINVGEPLIFNGSKNPDFFFIQQNDNDLIPKMIVDLCKHRLPQHNKVSPISDIQVLCPMSRSTNGSLNLNALLQQALNPSDTLLKRGGIEYRLHDKVMQTRNNYDKNI